jgi:hypothetical protein
MSRYPGCSTGWLTKPTPAGSQLPAVAPGWSLRAGIPRRGIAAWAAKLDADLDSGGLVVDAQFFPNGNDFRGLRVHQTRLQGGDASSDSYCYTG